MASLIFLSLDVPSKSPTKKRRPKGVQLCSYCGYATSRSYHFKRHMLRHTASKNGMIFFRCFKFHSSGRASSIKN